MRSVSNLSFAFPHLNACLPGFETPYVYLVFVKKVRIGNIDAGNGMRRV
jgi:hypothetical protein